MTAKANNSVARASVTRFIGNLPCIIEVVGRRGPPTAASIVSPAGPFQNLTGSAGGPVRSRGRDASYLAPPAQIRTCSFPAYGSYLGCVTAKRLSDHG